MGISLVEWVVAVLSLLMAFRQCGQKKLFFNGSSLNLPKDFLFNLMNKDLTLTDNNQSLTRSLSSTHLLNSQEETCQCHLMMEMLTYTNSLYFVSKWIETVMI